MHKIVAFPGTTGKIYDDGGRWKKSWDTARISMGQTGSPASLEISIRISVRCSPLFFFLIRIFREFVLRDAVYDEILVTHFQS